VHDMILVSVSDVNWSGCTCIMAGQVTGCCKHGNEPSGSIKGGEFLDCLRSS
jgi:hypothetical protein